MEPAAARQPLAGIGGLRRLTMSPASSSRESFSGRFILNNRREDIENAERSLLEAVEQRRYDRASLFAIRLALEEALNNAFKHGNKGDPLKIVRMHCHV